MLEDLNLTLNMATSGALANSSESMEDWRTGGKRTDQSSVMS